MKRKKSDLGVLLDYAGSYKCLTFLGLALSAVSMLLSMAPYICIWLAARDLIAVAPEWTRNGPGPKVLPGTDGWPLLLQ